MLFNSTVFLQFFGAFLLLYGLARNSLRARNVLIVGASWVFYGWWDWRFLGLLVFSGCFDFFIGLLLGRLHSARLRKIVLQLSLVTNLGLLGFFKYYDFFVGSLRDLLATAGIPINTATLGLILPVGISFYTFQSIGYVVDVYRREIKPTRSLLQYLTYVSFFPQLVAGPIQRGHDLLPQLETTRVITLLHLREGSWLILWGMFKKVVVADNLAPLVEMALDHPSSTAPLVIGGAVAFAFQIYGDFSGYSDIARGLARVLGFELRKNFNLPYFASDLRDFWRRWHISLSTWLRDYLYISLGGNRVSPGRTQFNLMVTMLLGGLWHGAAWNFLLWGAWHGMGLVALHAWNGRSSASRTLPRWFAWGFTLSFVMIGWIFFRARTVQHLVALAHSFADWGVPTWASSYVIALLLAILPLVLIEVWQARAQDEFATLRLPGWLRSGVQGIMFLSILMFWERDSVPFIYFQF